MFDHLCNKTLQGPTIVHLGDTCSFSYSLYSWKELIFFPTLSCFLDKIRLHFPVIFKNLIDFKICWKKIYRNKKILFNIVYMYTYFKTVYVWSLTAYCFLVESFISSNIFIYLASWWRSYTYAIVKADIKCRNYTKDHSFFPCIYWHRLWKRNCLRIDFFENVNTFVGFRYDIRTQRTQYYVNAITYK